MAMSLFPMAGPGRARGGPPFLQPLGYGAAAAGFTALALLLLHLLLAQRLEQQQRRQLVSQVSALVLLSEVALERYSPSDVSELIGTQVAVGPRPPQGGRAASLADGTLRRQAEALRRDLCGKLTTCPVVWAVGQRLPPGPGRGVWVQFNSPLETAWLFAPIPALRGWPPDPQLLSLAGALGGLATLLLFLTLEVQRPLRLLDGALEEVGLDQQPRPVPTRGTGAVRHLTARFNAMLARLQQGREERATLLAGVAHDLRAPLTRLRLRLAEEAPWTPERRQRAERDLSALERITSQFLSFVGAAGHEQAVLVPLDALVAEAANGVDSVEMALEPMERRVRPIALSRAVANLLPTRKPMATPPCAWRSAPCRKRVSPSRWPMGARASRRRSGSGPSNPSSASIRPAAGWATAAWGWPLPSRWPGPMAAP